MSRDISISFYPAGSDRSTSTSIEVRPPYYLFGTQNTSKRFWSISKLKELGIVHLTELGDTDPIFFVGWEMIADLGKEIMLLEQHLESIDFEPEVKAQWISHLVYCYHLLVQTAPKDSVPQMMIG